jgi:Na+/phosphate symporter
MKYMSDGMQAVAGEKMRTMIGKVTDNRFGACGTGAGITA